MGETVTLLEHRVRQVVERLKGLDAERERLTRELTSLRQEAKHAADTLDLVARDLSEEGA